RHRAMSRLREEQKAPMSRLREEQKAPMSRLREEQKIKGGFGRTLEGVSHYPALPALTSLCRPFGSVTSRTRRADTNNPETVPPPPSYPELAFFIHRCAAGDHATPAAVRTSVR